MDMIMPLWIPSPRKKWPSHIITFFTLTLLCSYVTLTASLPAYADSSAIPGGNVANATVRAVDIAKPAVVRIFTTIGGRLTVHFNDTISQTFPRTGDNYKVELTGSGSFISAHGDILTADHVINPPRDQALDQALQFEASQDVADYINNNLHPSVRWTAQDAFSAMQGSYFLTESRYDQPTSKVCLSTDYVGAINAKKLQDLPDGVSVDVDKIKKTSPVDNKDVAIIHVNIDDTPSIALGNSDNVAQQDELTILGFPGNGDLATDGQVPNTILTSSVNKIYVSAIKQRDNGAPLIQIGGNAEQGDSGGPALDKDGHIVGIVSFGAVQGGSTAFLQASKSAQELISALNIDTTPGKFQKQWSQAFNAYAANTDNHWHEAKKDLQNIQNAYPAFKAIDPYLTYASTQAQSENSSSTSATSNLPLIGIIGVVVIIVLVLLFALTRSNRRRRQGARMQPVPGIISEANGPFVNHMAGQQTPQPLAMSAPQPLPQQSPVLQPQQPLLPVQPSQPMPPVPQPVPVQTRAFAQEQRPLGQPVQPPVQSVPVAQSAQSAPIIVPAPNPAGPPTAFPKPQSPVPPYIPETPRFMGNNSQSAYSNGAESGGHQPPSPYAQNGPDASHLSFPNSGSIPPVARPGQPSQPMQPVQPGQPSQPAQRPPEQYRAARPSSPPVRAFNREDVLVRQPQQQGLYAPSENYGIPSYRQEVDKPPTTPSQRPDASLSRSASDEPTIRGGGSNNQPYLSFNDDDEPTGKHPSHPLNVSDEKTHKG